MSCSLYMKDVSEITKIHFFSTNLLKVASFAKTVVKVSAWNGLGILRQKACFVIAGLSCQLLKNVVPEWLTLSSQLSVKFVPKAFGVNTLMSGHFGRFFSFSFTIYGLWTSIQIAEQIVTKLFYVRALDTTAHLAQNRQLSTVKPFLTSYKLQSYIRAWQHEQYMCKHGFNTPFI